MRWQFCRHQVFCKGSWFVEILEWRGSTNHGSVSLEVRAGQWINVLSVHSARSGEEAQHVDGAQTSWRARRMISRQAGQRFHCCCTEVCGILWLDWRTESKPEPFSEDELRCHSLLSRCARWLSISLVEPRALVIYDQLIALSVIFNVKE